MKIKLKEIDEVLYKSYVERKEIKRNIKIIDQTLIKE